MIQLDFPNAVDTRARFFGRDKELSQIQKSLVESPSVPFTVIGERRIGKTSLQKIVVEYAREQMPEQWIPIVIEPRGVATVGEFADAVLARLRMALPGDERAEQRRFAVETPVQFENALEYLLADWRKQRFLLCIDEFDEILRRVKQTAGGAANLMGMIHDLVENRSSPISLFVTMTRFPEVEEQDTAALLLSKSLVISLGLWTPEDTGAMLSGVMEDKVVFGREEEAWLQRMSGGHPYITKLLLANLLQCFPSVLPMTVRVHMLEDALRSAVDDPRSSLALENIYRVHLTADEQRILLSLAEHDEAFSVEDLRRSSPGLVTAARTLHKRGYLSQNEDGSYALQAPFLGYWLRNWAEFEEEVERLNVHQIAGLL